MESWIAVTAVGQDRPGIVARVTEALLQWGCNLGETTMTRLRAEFAMILMVELPPTVSAGDTRQMLEALGKEMDLTVTVRALSVEEACSASGGGVSYIARVYGADRPGIVHGVTALLAGEGLNITDLETRVIPGETGPVYVMVLELDAPSEERGEAAGEKLQALAAEIAVELSFERLDQESM